jgi:hypothetical protein
VRRAEKMFRHGDGLRDRADVKRRTLAGDSPRSDRTNVLVSGVTASSGHIEQRASKLTYGIGYIPRYSRGEMSVAHRCGKDLQHRSTKSVIIHQRVCSRPP